MMPKSENYTMVNGAGQALTYYTFIEDNGEMKIHFQWNVQKRPEMYWTDENERFIFWRSTD